MQEFDLPEQEQPSEAREPGNQNCYSVSELAGAVKRTVEMAFDHVRVRGEISRPTYARSGHLYFTIKDENANLDVVCWRGSVTKLSLRAEEGMEIIATGRLTTYPGSSKYQLVLESFELAGVGALLKLLHERQARLEKEGLFANKRSLPFLPRCVGVVTSPTGAVFRDILHRIKDRFPCSVLLYPVKVQGEGAAAQIAAAITALNQIPEDYPQRPSVLIVGRGGGSLEDLWAFNEEEVIRAIFNSAIPVISAVGHETDTTLADFAADRRAPTPTAAAEFAVPIKSELHALVQELGLRLYKGANQLLNRYDERIQGLARGIPKPERLLEERSFAVDMYASRLESAHKQQLSHKQAALDKLEQRLKSPAQSLALKQAALDQSWHYACSALNQALRAKSERLSAIVPQQRLYQAIARFIKIQQNALHDLAQLLQSYQDLEQSALKRGYVQVLDHNAQVLVAAQQVSQGQALTLRFWDGKRAVQVVDGDASDAQAKLEVKPQKPRKTAHKDDPKQGSLF